MVSINLRVYRVFGFGAVRNGNRAARGGGGGGFQPPPGGGFGAGAGPGGGGGFGGGGGGRGGFGGGGGRGGFGGTETTDHRFNVTVGVQAVNILNHFNPAGYQGVLTTSQFLQPTTINTGFGGGGINTGVNAGGIGAGAVTGGPAGSVANNRRIELETRFTF